MRLSPGKKNKRETHTYRGEDEETKLLSSKQPKKVVGSNPPESLQEDCRVNEARGGKRRDTRTKEKDTTNQMTLKQLRVILNKETYYYIEFITKGKEEKGE